jgi:hypothetical protein
MFLEETSHPGSSDFMKKPAQSGTIYEFTTRRPDNFVEVEVTAEGDVTIRLARDNLNAPRKAAFVRHLAAEGFIPDRFLFLSDNELLGVTWELNAADAALGEGRERDSERRARLVLTMVLLVWGGVLAACLLYFLGWV